MGAAFRFTTTAMLFGQGLTLSADGKCRVLVLRGGGVHGSYEVGVFKALIESLDPIEYAYDVISGVSVGAINGSILAFYAPGDEINALAELESLYTNYLPQDYWEAWPYKVIEPFYKTSFVNP